LAARRVPPPDLIEPAPESAQRMKLTGPDAWPTPMFQTIRLTAVKGGTSVELFHHGFEQLGDDAGGELESYEAGWSNHHLVRLRTIVEQD